MTVTNLTIICDADEYCKYAIGMNIITITAKPTSGVLTNGESFTVKVLRQESASWPTAYRTVMTKTISITSAHVSSGLFSASFTLGIDDLDADGIARCNSGIYDVSITYTGSETPLWTAKGLIHVSLVSTTEMRNEWCYGAPLRASEVVAPRFQPRKVTGVIIKEVSPETIPGMKTLVFTKGATTSTLSWDGGEAVALSSARETVILSDEFENQYIIVVVEPALLPSITTTEKILVATGEMSDDMVRRRIQNAINSAESFLGFGIEPQLYTTMPKYGNQTAEHNRQMDHWDRIGRPGDYIVPTDGFAWPSFRLPYQWCIKMHNLYGFHSVDKIIEIEGDWWNTTIDRMSGYVTLVPALASFARWTVYTHPMLAPFFMHRNIPSFWHYNATFGLPDLLEPTRAPVREMVARTAAVSLLIEAGRGYQGGIGSEMTQRDGIMNSRNFNPGGPYAATIQQHQQWLQTDGQRLKFKLSGVQLGMIGAS